MSEDLAIGRGTTWEASVRVGLLLTCLLPLVYTPGVIFPYITPKGLVFQWTVAICGVVAVWLLGSRIVELEDARDPILWSLTAFVGVAAVSSVLGPATYESVFGNYERMWGIVQWVSLLLFYALLRSFLADADWKLFFRCTVYVAVAVALYAGLDSYLTNLVAPTPRTDGTLGNSGYLGAYLVLAVGAAALIAHHYRRVGRRAVAALAAILFAGAILISGNRSSLIGLGAGTVTVLLFLAVARARRSDLDLRWMLGGAGAVVAVAGAAFVFAPDVTSRIPVVARLADAGPSSGTLLYRLELWEAALEGFRARPLTGWGVDQFPLALDRMVDPAAYRLGSVRADRAHNVLLDRLVHTGLPGLVAYLTFWGVLATQTFRGWWRGRLSSLELTGFFVAFAGYFLYLQMWFEDHSSAALLIALAAYLRHRYAGGASLLTFGEKKDWSRVHSVSWAGLCIGLLALSVWNVGRSAIGARLMYLAGTAADLETRITHYERARQLDVPQHHEIASRYALNMGRLGRGAGDYLRRSDSLRAIYRSGVAGAEAALNRAAVRNPLSGRLDAARGRLAAGAGTVYRSQEIRDLARESFARAIDKSPPLLSYRHQLAITHGLFDQREAARRVLLETLDVYDGYGRTYYLLAQAHGGEIGATELRRLRQAFWLGYRPEDRSQLRRVVANLLDRDRANRAEQLLSVYVASHYLPAMRTVRDPFRKERQTFFEGLDADVAPTARQYEAYEIRPSDLTVMALWPRAAMEAGDCERAVTALQVLLNGLSERDRTASLRASLSRSLAAVSGRCAG